jgi:SPP1 gp7 family putative phage head morphogenesis protein
MSINDNIFDRIVDHMGDVRLYEEGVQLQNRRIIKRHRKNLRNLLTGNIRSNVKPEVSRFGKELLAHSDSSIKEFSTSQLDFHTDNLYKGVKDFYKVKKPRTKELIGEITGPNIKGTRSLKRNLQNISSGELVRIQSKVKAGLAKGLTQKDIISDVLKTTKITEQQAKTLTRTSITSTQSAALNKVMDSNKELLTGYMFTAILDSRTSPICSHHNGKVYSIDDKSYLPPLHWNCRSSMIPVVASKEELLKRDTSRLKKSVIKNKDEINLNGRPAKTKSFGEWLKTQSMSIQSKMLGSDEAANLFRQGKVKANEFVTPKGKGLTIQALRNKAAQITSVYSPKQKLREVGVQVNAKTPNSLLNNPKHKADLRQLFLLDSDDFNKTMSLTDYKGTSLVGKQASRRRVGNEFDERNFSVDPLSGEVKNNNIYDPDFNLYQERIDFMRNSKLMTLEQKDFVESVASGLDDKISLNQQTVIIENLRVVFERFSKDRIPWGDFAAVVRAENRFSVQNVSRLLDTRSRQKSKMFVGYLSKGSETPKVQIMGKYYGLDDLQSNMLKDQRYIDNWRATEGKRLATKLYFSGRAPMRAYFQRFATKYQSREEIVKQLKKNLPFNKQYVAFLKRFKKEPSDDWIVAKYAKGREAVQRILDLEFFHTKKKPTSTVFDNAALDSITKAAKLIASGQSTDYDALAINIGKRFSNDFKNIIPFTNHTLRDNHAEGSKILQFLVDQNMIRVQFRGKTRRGVLDLETGRASGGWSDTISREVTVIDKGLLRLQEAERRTVIARRIGVVSKRDRLFVKANKKTYVDARGNDTGIPLISAEKFPDYDAKQIDSDMANMMNHVMNSEYSVDSEFFDFMDDIVRFRDPRGNSKYYDSINEFRHEIINRGEQGYGMMSTAKWHRQRGKNFKTLAFLDSRGRVYHRGYLTPTGGEMVRPFLNSGKASFMTPSAMDELRIQLGAMIGPGTEALTQAGRREIFKRNESKLIELGGILQSVTQRDRRMRSFLEHPLVRGLEGPEVPKMARMALEYKRVYDHVEGNFNNTSRLATYKTKLMIENDASSSGAQIIGLSTGDRQVSMASNVLATNQKNRLYDLVAMDTVNDPDFLKIPALRDASLTWEDLAKGAKAQNMVSFYGAGEATKTANIAAKLAKVLDNKGYTSVTKENLSDQLRIIDGKIKLAERISATNTASELKSFRAEMIEIINKNEPVGRTLLKQAMEVHPDTADFVEKLMNSRKGVIGPKEFTEISRIMSNNLAQRAPVTDNFINFWKRTAKSFVLETKKVDIPWVTFDGKIMTQRYRPKLQEKIEFTDPVTGRKIANIYEASAPDGKLLGKSSVADASIGLGVNGNHSNDAVIVRRFHLWGRKNNVGTGTIHDAFFTNIGEAQRAKDALRAIYADALEGETIRKTLKEMRRQGLSNKTYREILAEAKRLGLIDPPNKITRKEILAPLKQGEDWYGIGP